MKKNLLLAAALSLALALSACGQTPPAAVSGPSAGSSGDAPLPASSETPDEPAPQPGREAHIVLIMEVEGQAEEVPATLYEGEGYSMYIPDEGWTKTAGKLPEGAVDQWVSDFNPEVTLTVCSNETEANWVESQKQSIVYDQKSEGGDAAFLGWAVYMDYPAEAAEGFGARLPVIAGTFLPTE